MRRGGLEEEIMNLSKKRQQFEKYKQKKQKILSQDSYIPMRVRKAIRPLLRGMLWVSRKMQGYEIEILNLTEFPKGKPLIFAVSHIAKLDFEIVSEVIKQQYYVLAADFVHMKGTFSGFYLWMNGVIYMDVLDKQDRKNSRDYMAKVLKQGGNIMLFPEGEWNFSPNELIYDIQLGTVDMAMETGAAIVLISLEIYDEQKKFVVNMGDAIEIDGGQNDTKEYIIQRTTELRDVMATLKYEIWEHEGITKRADMKYDYWIKYVQGRCAEWWGCDLRDQIINCYIPKVKLEYWDLMHDMRRMKVKEENRFLFVPKDEFLRDKE